ncbi:hypothetical protein [Desulfovibrio sp. SGI.169]|uniref:hypothetical protein n=1 Tax=Desulfovibrio sp. SGI.169 TaxID=3420561 RepID=UPI003CFCE7CA
MSVKKGDFPLGVRSGANGGADAATIPKKQEVLALAGKWAIAGGSALMRMTEKIAQ